MKRFLLAVALAALIVPSLMAQPSTRKIYADSLSPALSTHAVQVIKLARGWGDFKMLRSDIGAYKDKMLAIKIPGVMDSLKIQGGYVTFGIDTTWTDLNVKPNIRKVGVYTATGIAIPQSLKDTSVVWLTPVTTDQHNFIVDMSGFYFPFYRVVSGLADSTESRIHDIRRGGY